MSHSSLMESRRAVSWAPFSTSLYPTWDQVRSRAVRVLSRRVGRVLRSCEEF